ncbi:MAG: hypothetical protein HGA45_38730 [Chloroflexales bacterium]|nr:hypothetical protein [Chloroflexales bacterium]
MALHRAHLRLTIRADVDDDDRATLMAHYAQLGIALAIPSDQGQKDLPALTVAVLCRANSARSQLTEGWLRALRGGRLTVRSAGTQPAALHPLAEQVMAEVGVNIGHQHAKHVDALAQLRPDVVVTVCDIAAPDNA